ncbi:MAG: DUF4492 domain-containing protein [Bacteroidetes bacterium]|uniref:DUF4492 domain-containing protein n=1 Tax=Candidatus Gallipaludibacter merdavium TaxID=2840839 RepID=A0A9D9HTY6_9BACT|nr:DUF4492 domain-containing protein [Candidatus Gallipaludibacter merdavium]
MNDNNIFKRVALFYWDGFRNMTLGKTLWLIILIKLFIMFAILRVFFFPNYFAEMQTDAEKSDYVGTELVERIK